MKMRVEFENELDGEDFTLCYEDLTLRISETGQPLRPVSVEAGRIAIYDLTGATDLDGFIEALDQASWCYTGAAEVDAEPGPAF